MIDTINLAGNMEDDDRRSIAVGVRDGFEADDDSRSGWMEKHAEWVSLFYQNDTAIKNDRDWGSDDSLPMLTEACVQFHARAVQALMPTNTVVACIPVGRPDKAARERSERVARHLNHQLMVRDRQYKANKDALLLSVPVHGCAFTKTYRDDLWDRNVVENVRAQDLVIPYGVGPRSIAELSRKTHVLWTDSADVDARVSQGYFVDAPQPYEEGADDQITVAVDDASGIHQPGLERSRRLYCLLEQHVDLDLDEDGIPERYVITVDRTSGKMLRLVAAYHMDAKGRPVAHEYFTQYNFLPNPDGTYGLGMGHLIGKLNRASNDMLRDVVDAGHLANIGNMSGFINGALGISGGEVEFELGEFTKVSNSGGDIANSIYQMKFPGPQPVLFQVLGLLGQAATRVSTVTETLTGQADKVLQPTTLLALIEQGLQVFSGSFARLIDSWTDELQKIYRLNSIYLDDSEYFAVVGADGSVAEAQIAREDYAEDLRIFPIADPKLSTQQQKLAKAQAEWGFLSQNPLTVHNPMALYNASRRFLEALGTERIDEVLPAPMSPEMEVGNPAMENMLALLPVPQVPQAFPDQDHLLHIMVHEALLNDPAASSQLTPMGRTMLEQNVATHKAFLYGQTGQVGPTAGLGGMAAQPGNGGAPGMGGGADPGPLGGPGSGLGGSDIASLAGAPDAAPGNAGMAGGAGAPPVAGLMDGGR